MKIAVFGAGAIGSHLAVRLEQAGHAVGVVARGRQLAAIESQGLTLTVGDETIRAKPRASADPSVLGRHDVVFVTVKATALADVAASIAPLVGDDTLVVFAQNGMPWWYPIGLERSPSPLPALAVFGNRPSLLHVLRVDQVVPAVVYSANEVVAPAVVRNNSPLVNRVEIAALDAVADEPVARLRRVLEGAAIASPPVDDIRAAVWIKLIANASASSLQLAMRNPAAIAVDPDIRQTFLRLVDECSSVAAALGFDVAARLDVRRWTERPQHHKSSLLQDFEQGKPMEFAEIVEAPIAFARALNLHTPTLDAVVAIARRLVVDRGR